MHYDKCESPLEEIMWHYIEKTRGWDDCEAQVPIAGFRVDALFRHGDNRIVIEADGTAFHEQGRDWRRDKQILATGQVQWIVRVPYAAWQFYGFATLACLRNWFPQTFDCNLPNDCVSRVEMLQEIRKWKNDHHPDENWKDDAEFSAWVEGAEVWDDHEAFALAGSWAAVSHPKNIKPIRRYVAHERDIQR